MVRTRLAPGAVAAVLLIAGCGATPPASASPAGSPDRASASARLDFTRLPTGVSRAPILWLTADAGVTTDEASAVSAWTGLGGTAVAARSARPTVVADGIGGRPALVFDGIDDLLEVREVNINPSVNPDLTIVAVFTSDVDELTADDPWRKLYGADDGDWDRGAGLDTRAASNYVVFGGPTATTVGYFDLEANTPYLTVDAFRPTLLNGWVNGAQKIRDATIDTGEGLPTLFIGGLGTVISEPWQGKIAEIIVFDRVLAEPARVALEDFLALKYGLTLAR